MFMLMKRGHALATTMILLIVFVSLTTLEAQESLDEGRLPITITSDRMEGDFQGGVITFLNDVR